MATQAETTEQLRAALAAQVKTTAEIKTLLAAEAALKTANDALVAEKAALVLSNQQLDADKTALEAQVADLQAQLAAVPPPTTGDTTADLAAVSAEVLAKSQENDALLPDEVVTPPPPPPGDDAAILAEVSDNTLAGVNARLGPVAPAMTLPDVYERPLVQTHDLGWSGGQPPMLLSQGLETVSTANPKVNFDYGSTETQVIAVADLELAGTPNLDDVNAVVNTGTGVYRLRTEEHAQGGVSEAPQVMWNGGDQAFPDRDSVAHVRYNMHSKLGRPVAVARAKNNRYDVGFVLYDTSRGGGAFFGATGTTTAYPSWAGAVLPPEKIPLSLALSSQNEFLFIGCHDKNTGKGQIAVYWLWAGGDKQSAQNPNHFSFPFDFPKAHPGLVNSGMITGTKLFGFFDVPVKWPTSIGVAFSRNTSSNRIQGPDGNASYLNIWPLDTLGQRAAFLAQNDGWVSKWGKAVVTSRYENKAVMVDFTAMVAGVRDQYFASQELFAQTAYQNPAGVWDFYNLTDPMQFPWGIEAKSAWAPVVGAVVDLPSAPNAVLLSEDNQAQVAVAGKDGTVYFYKWDGSANGSIHVGDNPVHLSNDKLPDVRTAGLVVTCRASRSVVVVSKFGPAATILQTIQDNALIDPVAAEVGDTHGVQFKYITVADYNGKKIVNYRLSDLKFATQGGLVIPLGPGGTSTPPPFERGGQYAIPGHPFGLSGSNVN